MHSDPPRTSAGRVLRWRPGALCAAGLHRTGVRSAPAMLRAVGEPLRR